MFNDPLRYPYNAQSLALMLVAGFIFSSCVEGTKPKQNIYDDTYTPDRETGDTEPPFEDLPEPIVDANGVIGKDNTFEFGTWNIENFPGGNYN